MNTKILYFDFNWTHKKVYFMDKFYGWASIEDIERLFNGELTESELLARCIKKLPSGYFPKAHMDNYPNN